MKESIPLTEGTDDVTRRELNSEVTHVVELAKKDVELARKDVELLKKDVLFIDEKIAARDRELAKQALEYERRLADLNGEAGRIKKIQENSIPREVFDRTMEANKERHERDLQEIRNRHEIFAIEIRKDLKTITDYINIQGDLRRDLKPVTDYVQSQSGKSEMIKYLPTIITTLVSIAAIIFVILNYTKK